MSFILDLLENKAKPLYQRATFKILVKPLLFSDAIKMLDGVSDIDKAKYLAIFGNRPYYLDKIDKTKTFNENIISLCFSNTSILMDAPNMTLPIGFSNNTIYIAIIKALANNKKKIKELSNFIGIEEKVYRHIFLEYLKQQLLKENLCLMVIRKASITRYQIHLSNFIIGMSIHI